ncbi:MAG: short-chain dehydrogenase [Gemmatimonadetes bacterium]|nr:MAG: short-chain dehydrogenase [Gemmatimonadota bacterium]
MELNDRTVLVLGGAGLVGLAVARLVLEEKPSRLVIGSLRRDEAEGAVRELEQEGRTAGVQVEAVWGDLFVPHAFRERPRAEVMADPEARRQLVDDLYGELTDEVFERSALGRLLLDVRPDVIVDCINTAGALAYQNAFASAAELRARAEEGAADAEAVERHLATLYLPQLIRHAQIALEGMKRARTRIYVKVGTAGTGGMGLNIPFTHSEERPSRVLLAKSGLAGAQTLLLYLMARTPGAPAVKEVKPTAAISWKSIGFGPIRRGGRPLQRSDATGPVPVEAAFAGDADGAYVTLDEPLEGVYLDAGENGVFSLGEFETLTALGLMEFVTPEEIARNVVREIQAHPTGRDVVAALDAATLGPTYRAGVLRAAALERMEALEAEHGVEAVAYEMLGPPRLSKLLFEAALLRRLHGRIAEAAELDPEETARATQALIDGDADLRQRVLSIGLPILCADGTRVLRGAVVKVPPEAHDGLDEKAVQGGWVDLRPSNWAVWRKRLRDFRDRLAARPGLDQGSQADVDYGDDRGLLRPGRLAAWIFRYEDRGERIKR